MKKALVAVLLMAGIGAVAFASFNNKKKTSCPQEKNAKAKKDCERRCLFSL